jgi:acylphosphatase
MKAIHAYVSGRVQGVTYRQATRTAARGLDLVGWVRNLPDGRVEVWGQGEDGAVERLVEWLWLGPPGAAVTGVESEVVRIDRMLADFLIRQ